LKSGKSRSVKAEVDIPPGTHGAFETLQQQGIVDLSDGNAQQFMGRNKARRQSLFAQQTRRYETASPFYAGLGIKNPE